MKFAFERRSLPSFTIELPSAEDDLDAGYLRFAQAADAIAGEYVVRRGMRPKVDGRPFNPNLNLWAKRLCYSLLQHYFEVFDDELEGIFRKRFAILDRAEPDGKTNPFHKGLSAIFAGYREGVGMPRADQHRFGRIMWHAYYHHVPAIFLEAFSSQHPNLKAREADGKVQIDPAYATWIGSCVSPTPVEPRMWPMPFEIEGAVPSLRELLRDLQDERDDLLAELVKLRLRDDRAGEQSTSDSDDGWE